MSLANEEQLLEAKFESFIPFRPLLLDEHKAIFVMINSKVVDDWFVLTVKLTNGDTIVFGEMR
jgi:hypothetical protein